MKTKVLLFCFFAFAAVGAMTQTPTLDQVLEKYYKAGNFRKLSQVKTIVMTGTLEQQDRMPVKIVRVRPDKYLLEFDVADITAYQGYDGQMAWFTAPWTGNPAPQVAPPDRTTDMKNRADMDGLLINWKEKGHLPELVGTDTVNGHAVYKIKITRKDGGTEYNFIGKTDFMLQKRLIYRMAGGKEVQVETFYKDYRLVEGIPFAFAVETNNAGRVNEIQLDSVLLNRPVDLKIFNMPRKN